MFRKSLVSVAGAAVFAISASGGHGGKPMSVPTIRRRHSLKRFPRRILAFREVRAAASQPAKTVTYDGAEELLRGFDDGQRAPGRAFGTGACGLCREPVISRSDFVADLSSTR